MITEHKHCDLLLIGICARLKSLHVRSERCLYTRVFLLVYRGFAFREQFSSHSDLCVKVIYLSEDIDMTERYTAHFIMCVKIP